MTAHRQRILVVDDEHDILEFIQYNLEQGGYEVLTLNQSEGAIEKALEYKPDLIILDVMMPDLDGVELCRLMRAERQLADTIITFLTARSEDFTLIAGLDAGADEFINKPIRPRVLLSRVKALLRRAGVRKDDDQETMQFGELLVEPEQMAVKLHGKTIPMARKEFELLQLLVSKPGKVFSREEIFLKVWGTEVIVGNRTIDVHIRKLREKIGDGFIKTIKGIGYKFEF